MRCSLSEQAQFTLHERLEMDTREIMQLRLSMVLLMNDSTIPWLILVPMRNGIMEIHELSADDRAVLIEELSMVSEAIQEIFKPDKINIGMLGNIVPQLHIHVIGRFSNDRAWPGPVWGTPLGSPYAIEQADHVSAKIKQLLQKGC